MSVLDYRSIEALGDLLKPNEKDESEVNQTLHSLPFGSFFFLFSLPTDLEIYI
jgi:hypothetical protein